MPESRIAGSVKLEEWSKEVLTQLINLNNKCDNLTKENENIREDVRVMNDNFNKKMDVLNTILSGNGDPSKGLILRVALLEEAKNGFDEYIEEEKDTRKWITRSTVAACLTAVGSLAVTLFKLLFIKNGS